jgi:Heterokaryon incompatibility protein (HET)
MELINMENPAFEYYTRHLLQWLGNICDLTGCITLLQLGAPEWVYLTAMSFSGRSRPFLERTASVLPLCIPVWYELQIDCGNGFAPKARRFMHPWLQKGIGLAVSGIAFLTGQRILLGLGKVHPYLPLAFYGLVYPVKWSLLPLWPRYEQLWEGFNVELVMLLVERVLITPVRRRLYNRRALTAHRLLKDQSYGPIFKYSSLKLSRNFRLLRIEAEEASATLSEFDISSAPPYSAISYVWGDDSMKYSLRMGSDAYVHITPNAYKALAVVAPLRGAKYIWIDAIRI